MRILDWKLRSAGRKDFYSKVINLMFKYSHDVTVLLETKLNFNRAYKIFERSNLPYYTEIPPKGFSHGI